MSGLQPGNEEFRVINLSAEEREENLDGTRIEYAADASCYAEYAKGVELETSEGDTVEKETAGLEMIHVTSGVRGDGLGTKLIAKVMEEARREGFRYGRSRSIIDPIAVKLVERALEEGLIRRRAYSIQRPGALYDLGSGEMLEASTDVTPEEAAEAVPRLEDEDAGQGDVVRVECVVEL